MNDLVEKRFSLAPQNLDEAMHFAELMAGSTMVPAQYQKKAGDILVAVQHGAELGLTPMMSLKNIAVISGTPCLWGDSLIALARKSPLCDTIREEFDEHTMTATCYVKRKGEEVENRSFSKDDAVVANLWSKKGVWQTYPKRMLQMRARSWAIRDVFPDLLCGLSVAEEVQDYEEKDITPQQTEKNKLIHEAIERKSQKKKEKVIEGETEDLPLLEQWRLTINSCCELRELEEVGEKLKTCKDLDKSDMDLLRKVYTHKKSSLSGNN